MRDLRRHLRPGAVALVAAVLAFAGCGDADEVESAQSTTTLTTTTSAPESTTTTTTAPEPATAPTNPPKPDVCAPDMGTTIEREPRWYPPHGRFPDPPEGWEEPDRDVFDWDGDGATDTLALADDTVTLTWATGQVVVTGVQTDYLSRPAYDDDGREFETHPWDRGGPTHIPAAVGDVTGDGLADLVVFHGGHTAVMIGQGAATPSWNPRLRRRGSHDPRVAVSAGSRGGPRRRRDRRGQACIRSRSVTWRSCGTRPETARTSSRSRGGGIVPRPASSTSRESHATCPAASQVYPARALVTQVGQWGRPIDRLPRPRRRSLGEVEGGNRCAPIATGRRRYARHGGGRPMGDLRTHLLSQHLRPGAVALVAAVLAFAGCGDADEVESAQSSTTPATTTSAPESTTTTTTAPEPATAPTNPPKPDVCAPDMGSTLQAFRWYPPYPPFPYPPEGWEEPDRDVFDWDGDGATDTLALADDTVTLTWATGQVVVTGVQTDYLSRPAVRRRREGVPLLPEHLRRGGAGGQAHPRGGGRRHGRRARRPRRVPRRPHSGDDRPGRRHTVGDPRLRRRGSHHPRLAVAAVQAAWFGRSCHRRG